MHQEAACCKSEARKRAAQFHHIDTFPSSDDGYATSVSARAGMYTALPSRRRRPLLMQASAGVRINNGRRQASAGAGKPRFDQWIIDVAAVAATGSRPAASATLDAVVRLR